MVTAAGQNVSGDDNLLVVADELDEIGRPDLAGIVRANVVNMEKRFAAEFRGRKMYLELRDMSIQDPLDAVSTVNAVFVIMEDF